MLAEAASACFYAGNPAEMLRAWPSGPGPRWPPAVGPGALPGRDGAGHGPDLRRRRGGRRRGRARGGHAGRGLAPRSATTCGCCPGWPSRRCSCARPAPGAPLLAHALQTARARAAVGVLPFALSLIARDQATSDRWAVAEADLPGGHQPGARERPARPRWRFGLAGLAWLHARRGREQDCRGLRRRGAGAQRASWARSCSRSGPRPRSASSSSGLGDAAAAVGHFERQRQLLADLAITDADLSPAPELVDGYLRARPRPTRRRRAAAEFTADRARPRASPGRWPGRCAAGACWPPDAGFAADFEQALGLHEQTPDLFEAARTRLAYGERLRRSRNRVLARDQLRAAVGRVRAPGRPALGRPGPRRAGRHRGDAAAAGRGRLDALTPQELQIALLLAGGRTTREAAAALFLSPKTVEYHLRHVYQRLGLHSREELAERLSQADGTAAVIRVRQRPATE